MSTFPGEELENANHRIAGIMYAVNENNKPFQPMAEYVQQLQLRKSKPLIIFGVFIIGLSSLLLLFCFVAANSDYANISGCIGIFSAIFHIILGVMGIIGGTDTIQRRSYVIACLVMGIVGCSVFVLTTITLAAIQWGDSGSRCSRWDTDCNRPVFLNVVIVLLSFIQAIVDIVLSSLTCQKMCVCCYLIDPQANQVVVQLGPIVTNPMQNRQMPLTYGASQYPNQMQQTSIENGELKQHPQTGYVVTDDRVRLV